MDEIDRVIAGLTKAQLTALHNLAVCHERKPWDWHEAPHDGWRRAGAACNGLWRLDLAAIGGRRKGLTLYRLTLLGLEVSARLNAHHQPTEKEHTQNVTD
ncbi:hypothetical protein [Novosphingobium sp. Leaf2]|uniref:hypothetical protein n=1 Tax=Novosphingobium sp. Leaf2 TaxID=1735670 RepID=UPI0006FF1A90|nr:hypothetical protein [Novosphingobium sp. Leaf2]KQM18367.1 hypothetical protein ASE49_09150 [Novosphingobium sp. Leaf2]